MADRPVDPEARAEAIAQCREALSLVGFVWQGKPAADLTDDELGEAVRALVKRIAQAFAPLRGKFARARGVVTRELPGGGVVLADASAQLNAAAARSGSHDRARRLS